MVVYLCSPQFVCYLPAEAEAAFAGAENRKWRNYNNLTGSYVYMKGLYKLFNRGKSLEIFFSFFLEL